MEKANSPIPNIQPDSTEGKITAKQLSPTAWWIRELIAAILWIIGLVKLFIFDIDIKVAEYIASGASGYLNYRIFGLLGIIALLWLTLGNQRFIYFVAYTIFYPFIVVFFHIPRIIFRNWAVAIAFSPAIHSIVATFRWNFIFATLAIFAALSINITTASPILYVAMIILATFLFYHFFRRFRVAFQPSTVFADAAPLVRKIWKKVTEQEFMKLDGIEIGSKEYESRQGTNLLCLYIFATSLGFLAEKLGEIIQSRKLDLYFIGSLLYTLAITTLIFGFEYQALELINPGNFNVSDTLNFMSFLGYSFSSIMHSSISSLRAVSTPALIVSYIELFCSLLILVLLVFVILTVIRERYKQDIGGVINDMTELSNNIGQLIEDTFHLSITAAGVKIVEINPGMEWLVKLLERGEK